MQGAPQHPQHTNTETSETVINIEKLRNNYEYFPAQPRPAHIHKTGGEEATPDTSAEESRGRTLCWFLADRVGPITAVWVFSLADQFSDRQHRDWKVRGRTRHCGRGIVIWDDNGSMISQDFLSVFLENSHKEGMMLQG